MIIPKHINLIPEICAYLQWNNDVTAVIFMSDTAEERKEFSRELSKFLNLPINNPYIEPFKVNVTYDSLVQKHLENGSRVLIKPLNGNSLRGFGINRMYVPLSGNKEKIAEIMTLYPCLCTARAGNLLRY